MEFYTLGMGLGNFVFRANNLDLADVATVYPDASGLRSIVVLLSGFFTVYSTIDTKLSPKFSMMSPAIMASIEYLSAAISPATP